MSCSKRGLSKLTHCGEQILSLRAPPARVPAATISGGRPPGTLAPRAAETVGTAPGELCLPADVCPLVWDSSSLVFPPHTPWVCHGPWFCCQQWELPRSARPPLSPPWQLWLEVQGCPGEELHATHGTQEHCSWLCWWHLTWATAATEWVLGSLAARHVGLGDSLDLLSHETSLSGFH